MDTKFQLLYDYLNSSGSLKEGSTPESFKERYVSGESNINALYDILSSEDPPFELGDINQFSDEFFGLKKKDSTETDPAANQGAGQAETSPSVSPLGEVSTELTSASPQPQGQPLGDSDSTVAPSGELDLWPTTPSAPYSKGFGYATGLAQRIKFDAGRTFLKGTTGTIVNSIPVFGPFFDDMARSLAIGYSNVQTYDETRWMFGERSKESANAFFMAMVEHNENVERYGVSEDMQGLLDSLEKNQEEHGEWFGMFKSLLYEHPGALPEFFLTSAVNQIDPVALKEAAKVIALGTTGGAGIGAALTTPLGGIGAIPGAIGGFVTSIPFAYAAMGKEAEVVNSSVEFLIEELEERSLEFTPENIYSVLSDDEAYKRIRNRASARGNTIMAVDAIFGSVFSNVARTLKIADKVKDVPIVAGAIVGDAIAGGGGEALARSAAGQESSAFDVGVEAFTGMTTAPITLASTYIGIRQQKAAEEARRFGSHTPKRYYINEGRVTEEVFRDVLETSDPTETKNISFRVDNDPKMMEEVNSKFEQADIELGISEDITGETRKTLIELETQLKRLEGSTAHVAAIRRKEIQAEIDLVLEEHKTASKPTAIDFSKKQTFVGGVTEAIKKGNPFAHITAENPGNETMSPEENAQRNAELKVDLEAMGYNPIEIDGKSDRDEKSFFVEGITEADAITLGKKYGQQSVAHSAGMLYTTGENAGKKNPTTGDVVVDDNLDNMYSVMPTEEGDVKYQIGYDWESFEDIETSTDQELTAEQTEDIVTEAEDKAVELSAEELEAQRLDLQQRAEEEDIYIPKPFTTKGFAADVLGGKTLLQRRWTSARKLMPRSMFQHTESAQAHISSAMNTVRSHAKQLGVIEANIKPENRERFTKDFDAFLRGEKLEEDHQLTLEAIMLARDMGAHRDNFSMRLINEGAVPAGESIDNVISNLGQYLNRSYRLFETNNWKETVLEEEGQKILNQGLEFFRKYHPEIAEQARRDLKNAEANPQGLSLEELTNERLRARVEGILNQDGNSFLSSPKISGKDLGVLQEKKDIPLGIRTLMGEISDPLTNYAQTIFKQAQLVETHAMLNKIKDSGMGVYLFEQPTGNFNTLIAAEGSETKSPINGLYTTPEIAAEFNAKGGVGTNQSPASVVINDLFSSWMKVTGTVKWAKTIGSVGTHMKNVFGNLGFMAANGHTDISMWNRTLGIVRNDLGSMSDKELNARMSHYIELGIVKQNVGVGEIRAMLGKENEFGDLMKTNIENSTKKNLREKIKLAEDLYTSEDDFYKIIAYENEKGRYSKAVYGVDQSQLTEQQAKELDAKVAEIVKNTYPTYSRTPELVNLLKINPILGNFVSFQAESYRTMWNIVSTAQEELRSDNPAVQAIGAKRMGGLLAFQSLKTGAIGFSTAAVGMGVTGVIGAFTSSEEEKEIEEAVRDYVAPWSKTSQLGMVSMEPGNFSYKDASASDPFGGLDKVVNAATSGEDPIEAFTRGAMALIEPFVGVDIATRRISNVLNNQNDYGGHIYNPTEGFADQSWDILSYMYSVIEPGTLTSIRKVAGSDEPLNELLGQATGFKTQEVPVLKAFGYKMAAFKEDIAFARKLRWEDYNQGSNVYEEASVDNANKALRRVELEILDQAQKAHLLGVPLLEIRDVMVERGGMTKKRANYLLNVDSSGESDPLFLPLTRER